MPSPFLAQQQFFLAEAERNQRIADLYAALADEPDAAAELQERDMEYLAGLSGSVAVVDLTEPPFAFEPAPLTAAEQSGFDYYGRYLGLQTAVATFVDLDPNYVGKVARGTKRDTYVLAVLRRAMAAVDVSLTLQIEADEAATEEAA